jgi:tRNA pseudouridine32 synthase/23S rRNA pseudouridine746 synthase
MKFFSLDLKTKFTKPPTLMEALTFLKKFNSSQIEDLTTKGAVWIKNKTKTIQRCYKIDHKLNLDDTLLVYYDPRILSLPALTKADCLFENKHYGIWLKPVGVLSQGSQASDHTSLFRFIEKLKGKVYLVHRLDRETSGVMIFSYTAESAKQFSKMFQEHRVFKVYEAIVSGILPLGVEQTISFDLDDKKALTRFTGLKAQSDKTLVSIVLETGRLHQIRRHFNMLGHPVMGDPKYGIGNKNKEGLKLLAKEIRFLDPWSKKEVSFTYPDSLSF